MVYMVFLYSFEGGPGDAAGLKSQPGNVGLRLGSNRNRQHEYLVLPGYLEQRYCLFVNTKNGS